MELILHYIILTFYILSKSMTTRFSSVWLDVQVQLPNPKTNTTADQYDHSVAFSGGGPRYIDPNQLIGAYQGRRTYSSALNDARWGWMSARWMCCDYKSSLTRCWRLGEALIWRPVFTLPSAPFHSLTMGTCHQPDGGFEATLTAATVSYWFLALAYKLILYTRLLLYKNITWTWIKVPHSLQKIKK